MFEVHRLSEDREIPGVAICGLDPLDLDQHHIREALRQIWIEAGLIVFRGLTGAATHVRLSEVFGPCVAHPAKPKDPPSLYPQLLPIRYDAGQGDVSEVAGRQLGAYLPWHSDLIYVDEINRGAILRPLALSQDGGETGFIDKIRLYETLPKDLQQALEGRYVVYKWTTDVAVQRYGKRVGSKMVSWSDRRAEMQSRVDNYPRVAHPAIYEQIGTGRKVLNVSPWFAEGIEDMDQAEADALLTRVVDHIHEERFAYYHKYRADDMVLWDNWRVLHCAAGVPPEQSRWLERSTIAGDYALGHVARGEALAGERLKIII